MKILLLLSFVISMSVSFSQEVCNDFIDNDNDGLVDCDDPGCAPCASSDVCSFLPFRNFVATGTGRSSSNAANSLNSDNVFMTVNSLGLVDKEILVVVRDIQGKEFYTKVLLIETEGQIIALDITNTLASGVYLVTASSANELYSQKLIIQ